MFRDYLQVSADSADRSSFAHRLRKRRHAFFAKLLAGLPAPVKILDVGGTTTYWEMMGHGSNSAVEVTLLNLHKDTGSSNRIHKIIGDGTDMAMFHDQSFDVVFSNSVIEHVGGPDRQARFAQEVMRVGKRYFVQTPNYWFPIEPHFVFPFVHLAPRSMCVACLMRFGLGVVPRIPSREEAEKAVGSIRLLSVNSLRVLFPGCRIFRERFLGFVKSVTAYGGW